jgi:hypothetical protein
MVLSSIFINAILLCTFSKQMNNLMENKCLESIFKISHIEEFLHKISQTEHLSLPNAATRHELVSAILLHY